MQKENIFEKKLPAGHNIGFYLPVKPSPSRPQLFGYGI
jgi:hypothetical protein